jgi:hypothetical protein
MIRGFGSDSVFNYEVVLSNGTILEANRASSTDLFWALKLGSTNYGIVTRFDMYTYASPEIWGRLVAYPITPQSIADLFAAFEKHGHDNQNDNISSAVILSHSKGSDSIAAAHVTLNGKPLGNLTNVAPLMTSEKVGSTHDVVDQVIAKVIEPQSRTSWYTTTTRVDSELFKAIYDQTGRVFEPLKNSSDLSWTMTFQAVQKSYIERAANTPVYNALKRSSDDLVGW